MKASFPIVSRKVHRWGALAIALPIGVVVVTGILLQLKKQMSWVQPPTKRGVTAELTVSFEQVLRAVQAVPQAEVKGWADIERIDVQPRRGLAKVMPKNRWEVQIDTGTGKILQVAYRRSDVIESLHDGSWFHDSLKLWLFLPTAVVLLALWLTGLYLFALPYIVNARRRRRMRTTQPGPLSNAESVRVRP